MYLFYSPFSLLDRNPAGPHFASQLQQFISNTLILPLPCWCIFFRSINIIFYVEVHQASLVKPLESTSPDNIQKSAHIGSFRSGGIQSGTLCSLCKLCPLLSHTLWIRWVIAKQPRVMGDAVVIVMGLFAEPPLQEHQLLVTDKKSPAGSHQNSSSELSASSMAWSWRLVPGSRGCWGVEMKIKSCIDNISSR